MIEREKKEEWSVNRPRVSEIFGRRSQASGYTIFSCSPTARSTRVDYGEHLLLTRTTSSGT